MMVPAIWTAMYAELSLPEALRALHDCGWQAFEISTEHLEAIETDPQPDRRVDEARRCLVELGLSAPQAHAYLKADLAAADPKARADDLARLLRHLDLAAKLGVRNVVVHPGGKQNPDGDSDRIRRWNVEAFRRLGDAAAERGLRIGVENMTAPGARTAEDLLDLLAAINHSALGITFDSSHAHASGLDAAQAIRDLGPHLVGTHLSDNDRSRDQHKTPGGGTIDWPAVMAALRAAGYDGLLNLEIPGERHPLPALRALKVRHALAVCKWLASLGTTP